VAHLTFSTLLDSRRCARLVLQSALDDNQPGLGEVLDEMLDRTVRARPDKDPYHREIRRTVTLRFLNHLVALGSNTSAAAQVRATALEKIRTVLRFASRRLPTAKDPDRHAHLNYLKARLGEYLKHPDQAVTLAEAPYVPPGEPI
jgi:hypothetical protein